MEAIRNIFKMHIFFLFVSESTGMFVLNVTVNLWDLPAVIYSGDTHLRMLLKKTEKQHLVEETQEWQKICSISCHYLYSVGSNQP